MTIDIFYYLIGLPIAMQMYLLLMSQGVMGYLLLQTVTLCAMNDTYRDTECLYAIESKLGIEGFYYMLWLIMRTYMVDNEDIYWNN